MTSGVPAPLTVHEESVLAAATASAALDRGWTPPALDVEFPLAQGELALYRTPVHLWIYSGEHVSYSSPRFLALGSPGMLAASLAGSAMYGSHKKKQAEAEAAPRWRPVDDGEAVVTSTRFACRLSQGWKDLVFASLRSSTCDARGITLWYEGMPPLTLAMPYPEAVYVFFHHAAYGTIEHFTVDDALRAKATALGRVVP